MSILLLYPGLKLSFQHKSASKNLFLVAFSCWDSRLSVHDMDRKLNCGGITGCGDSYLEVTFRLLKILRLHALLHDVVGAVQSHSGKVPGHC